MTVTAQNLRSTMKKNKNKAEGRNVATLNSLEKKVKLVAFSDKMDLYGPFLDEVKYEENIYRGGEKEIRGDKRSTEETTNNKGTYTPTPEDRIKSNNNQLKKKMRRYIIANLEFFNTFITLTPGHKDLYDLFSSYSNDHRKNKLYIADQLTQKELDLLKGKTDLRYKKDKDIRYLNVTQEEIDLRTKILRILYKQMIPMKNKIIKSLKEENINISKQNIKRKFARNITDLLAKEDPYNVENAKANLNRLIENLKNETEAYEGEFKYITVLEFQENGRPHFHMLTNLKYLKQSKLQKKWGKGIVHISSIDSINASGLYINKKDNLKTKATKLSNYFTEQISETREDPRTDDTKIMTSSQNLLRKPLEVITPELKRIVAQYVYSNSVEIDWESGLIEGKGEYSKGFQITRRVMENSNIYLLIEQKAGQLLDKILEIAEKLNSDIITKDIYYQAKHELFYKDQGYMPDTRAA